MTTKTKIEQAIELLRQALSELDVPAPDPEPQPEPACLVRVDVVKTNAWCAGSKNKQGVPVMKIYPENESNTKDRVQWVNDTHLRVKCKVVKADGGEQFYQLVDPVKKNGVVVPVDLYLRADHVTLV